MKRTHSLGLLLALAVGLFALGPAVSQAALIVDDDFSDVDRTKTGALDADWWSSSSTSGNSVEIDGTGLGLRSGTSGRGIHATFAPQNLAVGEKIEVTYAFTTPATVGNNRSTALKVALMDGTNAALADDLSSSSSTANPVYVALPGFMADFDVNTGSAADVSIREHNTVPPVPLDGVNGRFLGTTGEWTNLGSSPDAGYSFTANTDYVGVFSVLRTSVDEMVVFSSMSEAGGALLDEEARIDSASDTNGQGNNFGMFGVWVNSNTFGSTNSAGDPDNGITLTNVVVRTFVPEPTTAVLLLVGLAVAPLRLRR
ncbi:MAG: hypothetical protein AAGA92_04880 [Planctomycetota bacterium]